MASNFSQEFLSILVCFLLLLSYSLVVKGDGGSNKNSDVNDFAEFETEDDDDDEGDDNYEDEIENLKPPERHRADEEEEDDDDGIDVETGRFNIES